MDLSCEERPSDSLFVERIWRSEAVDGGEFISIAHTRWEMVVTRYMGKMSFTIRGPETRATPAFCPPGVEFIGIQFKAGSFMPKWPPKILMNRSDLNLPEASKRRFWLNSTTWQFPDFENADTFVDWLVRDGLLVHDSMAAQALQGIPTYSSQRTVQRRLLQATGLSYNAARQIARARYATLLLKGGVSILDTSHMAGYADQPHLTRSLKHFVGQTPAQIICETRAEKLSFLFNTSPI